MSEAFYINIGQKLKKNSQLKIKKEIRKLFHYSFTETELRFINFAGTKC